MCLPIIKGNPAWRIQTVLLWIDWRPFPAYSQHPCPHLQLSIWIYINAERGSQLPVPIQYRREMPARLPRFMMNGLLAITFDPTFLPPVSHSRPEAPYHWEEIFSGIPTSLDESQPERSPGADSLTHPQAQPLHLGIPQIRIWQR